jgi:hypothetical protein
MILNSLKRLIMYAAFGITKRIDTSPPYKPRTQTMAVNLKQTSASNSESTTAEGEEEGGGSDADCISVSDSEHSQGQGPNQPQQQQQGWPPSIPSLYSAPYSNPAVRAWLRASKELVCMTTVKAEVSQVLWLPNTALMMVQLPACLAAIVSMSPAVFDGFSMPW